MEIYCSNYSTPSIKSITSVLLTGLSLLIFSAIAQAENQLNNVKVSALPDDQVEITLEFSSSPSEPLAFTTDNPARIALDFADTNVAIQNRFQDINIGQAKTINTVQSNGRTRVVVNLSSLQEYMLRQEGNNYILRIGDGDLASANDPAIVSSNTATAPRKTTNKATGNNIDLIDFRRGDNNSGRVLISLSNPNVPVSLIEQGGSIILNFENTALATSMQKRFDVKDFATPVNFISSSSKGNDTKVVIQPDAGLDYEHLAYQSDNLYVLEVREVPDELIEARRKQTYEGERLSLNFQNIEVRSVLQLIADFTGLNLVVSDSVGGALTLRLKNVPWDQALDIILKTKGLGMRENGNVLYIAPNEEIAAREKLELESQQQVEELAPLRSEFLEINYAKASDLASLLKDSDNTLLSDRGQVSVDDRTNTLLVQDTALKLNEIRRLVERLDTPVKQVLIESRIVVANDDFSKTLGAKFGVFNANGGDLGNNNVADVIGGNLDLLEPLTAGDPIPIADTLNVNLPVPEREGGGVAGGQFALSFIKLPFGYALNLELSAAQLESRAEVISNPRVITANQSTANIESGTEIPYVSQTSSGATDVEFKKAVLALEVTPQITPDDRINMEVNVKNDSVGQVFQGIPSIDTNEITSNVLVNNGQTVVLGGIYTEESSGAVTKVPFFGDLPIAGRLFRNDTSTNNKSELLIFITPKIIDEQLNLTR
ncbi:MAG: type IV pilus secretin PilQ [Gammaproteobacteria bacterium]|nr:type IV pilus secretin PilQ [Gammaproteobacteria bacterium]